MADCPHGDDPLLCPPCQGPPGGTLRFVTPDSRPFSAQYDGECAGCGFDIRRGETVMYRGGRLNHSGCARG